MSGLRLGNTHGNDPGHPQEQEIERKEDRKAGGRPERSTAEPMKYSTMSPIMKMRQTMISDVVPSILY
jgi:hypothetical protein